MFFLHTESKTIVLLKEQLRQVENDQKILTSSEQIYAQYEQDIDAILNVFPNEETVLDFLQRLEKLTKDTSDDSTVRFASLNPLPDGDKLFLLFNISLKTDTARLDQFLDSLEHLPYMTRVIGLSTTFPDLSPQKVDASVSLKLYVKNPFSTK